MHFGRRCYEEHFCEIILNLDCTVVKKEMSFKDISVFRIEGYFIFPVKYHYKIYLSDIF